MKRNKITEDPDQYRLIAHKQRVAFHEAGHAAGIHLNNKARGLPPVFFNIIFKDMIDMTPTDIMAYQINHGDCIARVEGGRLIELLPPSLENLVHELTDHNDAMVQLLKDYTIAFEADIINLLIGPLAEAKHISDTDDEPFNYRLINLKALKNYGGSSDLALVNEYLQSFSSDKLQQDKKLEALFILAFNFINNDANWLAITKLADYILNGCKNIIDYEEVVSMLEQSVAHFRNRKINARNYFNG